MAHFGEIFVLVLLYYVIYYLDKIESLNFGRRVLGNGRAEYEVDYTTG